MDPASFSSFPSVALRSASAVLKNSEKVEQNKPEFFETVASSNAPQSALHAKMNERVEVFGSISVKTNEKHLERIALSTPDVRPKVVRRLSNKELDELASLPYEKRKERIKELLASHLRTDTLKAHKSTLLAIIKAESNFDPLAVSDDGFESKGLFQLLDKTGLTVKERLSDISPYNPWDPGRNIKYGVAYFEYLINIFRSPTLLQNGLKTFPADNYEEAEKFAIASFNAGEGRTAYAQALALKKGLNPGLFEHVKDFLPPITVNYVSKVLRYKENFEQSSNGTDIAIRPS